MTDRIIYVLCYDDSSEEQAIRLFSQYEWARVYRIPADTQSHLFEGVMYQSELMKLYDEWKDKKYVGTIAYNFWSKNNPPGNTNADRWNLKCNHMLYHKILTPNSYDFVGFLPMTHHHFERHNPSLRTLFEFLCKQLLPRPPLKFGLSNHANIDNLPFFFYNYWMTTPAHMLRYIEFFNQRWLPVLESHPMVWENAYYNGAVSPERLLELSKGRCGYYSFHPFINERLPNIYFRSINAKMLL
jgi:hypothetical protein